MYCAVLTFDSLTDLTTGTFTVTGVVDGTTGTPFQGTWFMVQGGTTFSTDTILYQAINFFSANAKSDVLGAQDLTQGSGGAQAERGQGFRQVNGAISSGYPILNLEATTLFGGIVTIAAYVSASRVGEFDVTMPFNSGNVTFTTSFAIVVFGGDDLTVEFPNSTGIPQLQDGNYPCSARPAAFFCLSASGAGPLGTSTATGAGGGQMGYGWEARDSGRGTATYLLAGQFGTPSPSPNSGVVCTDRLGVNFASGSAIDTPAPIVGAWHDSPPSVDITGSMGSGFGYAPVIFSGDLIQAVALDFTQDPDPITAMQTVALGIYPRWIMVASEGTDDLNTPSVTKLDHAIGWTDGSSQIGFWTGQDADGQLSPLTGARWLSTSSLLRFATANAASTTFDAIMEFVSIETDGTLTVHWPTDDGGARRILLFAIGEAIPPPPPTPTPVYRTREVVRRRLRRAPIVWSEKGGLQTRVRINLFAVDMQPGVGTTDTPDPLVMIRASKDGGFTWSNERRVSAGRIGEYFDRINTWRWGQGREWVFEVACTDPVTWNLLGAYFDAEVGES
jgi:hypothetical protein